MHSNVIPLSIKICIEVNEEDGVTSKCFYIYIDILGVSDRSGYLKFMCAHVFAGRCS